MADSTMTLDEIYAGIRDSIANARPDLKRERGDLLQQLEQAVNERNFEKVMAVLERLDIVDHFPAVQRPGGVYEPQPMPGGWVSWYGWMMTMKEWEEAEYRAAAIKDAKPDIPESEIKKTLW
jgi:hypothetical protein